MNLSRVSRPLGLACLLLTAAACAPAPAARSAAAAKEAARGGVTAPIGATGSSSAVALARIDGRRVAFVADADARAILTVDATTKQELAQTKVDGVPAQLLMTADGRLFATVRDRNKIVVLRATGAESALTKVTELSTYAEPFALATTPDERTLLVTCAWDRRLAAYDTRDFTRRFTTKLPREPRGVVVAEDGNTAFVAHAVGSVTSVIDLARGAHAARELPMRGPDGSLSQIVQHTQRHIESRSRIPKEFREREFASLARLEKREREGRGSCQGFVLAKSTAVPNRVFAPQVMVDPGDPEERTSGYGSPMNGPPEIAAIGVIDEAAFQPVRASMTSPRPDGILLPLGLVSVPGRESTAPTECLLPRAAAIDPRSKSLLVTCLGIDRVVAYDATAASPTAAMRHSWSVGAGPMGVAIDAEAREAFVFSQFDRTVATLPLGDLDGLVDDHGEPAKVPRTALAPLAGGPPTQLVVGRMLFHASGDRRISDDGRVCASCHPDGRDDAITWATPEGPRRSIMLAGRVGGTAPYSWDGNANTIERHLGATFQRLRGAGLHNSELDALVAYVSSLPPPPPRVFDEHEKSIVERGRAIFASSETQCLTCHSGATLTDGANHDVGSRAEIDPRPEFNTPSLRFVGSAGPFFHDGRFGTFQEMLRATDGRMGKTKHLSNADLDALASYLETL